MQLCRAEPILPKPDLKLYFEVDMMIDINIVSGALKLDRDATAGIFIVESTSSILVIPVLHISLIYIA